MIFSMTGFGKAVEQTGSHSVRVEIKSVNSKQLDLTMKLPNRFKEMEVSMRGVVSRLLGRGKVEVWANVENIDGNSGIEFNQKVIESYKNKIQKIGDNLNLGNPQDWYSLLLRLPDVSNSDNSELTSEERKAMEKTIEEALNELIKFRKKEGEKLELFFSEKISALRNLLDLVAPFEEERILKIRTKLEDNLKRLDGIEYDNGRLEQELIFYIEKLDVTEEKTRLAAHLSYFMETMNASHESAAEGQGKKLGFIAQEIGREINTLGSKANHAEMQKIVVMMKDELEQIKEQVLNIL